VVLYYLGLANQVWAAPLVFTYYQLQEDNLYLQLKAYLVIGLACLDQSLVMTVVDVAASSSVVS